MKYIQLSENLQRNLIFSISPKSQPRVYLSNIQRHSLKKIVQIDFLLVDQSYNRPPWFTALASRKERDDFSSLKHVLSEPHTASSQSHIFLLPSRVIRHAKLMHERQAAKPLGRQKFEIISLIWTSLLVIALAGIIMNWTASTLPLR